MRSLLFPLLSVFFLCIFAIESVGQQRQVNPPIPATSRSFNPTNIDSARNTDPSLNGQYQFMLSRSKTLNGYKLVNPYRLSALWQSVSDTLIAERKQSGQLKVSTEAQKNRISQLERQLADKENVLLTHEEKGDELSFLGLEMGKGLYHTLVWSIILLLAIALTVVVLSSSKNKLDARDKKQLYADLTKEFQSYKSKAQEKERKLARELQDERNLVEELKGKGK